MTLILLLLNTVLFIALLLNTANIAKNNEEKMKLLKQDNERWKNEVRELLNFIKSTTERTDLWVNIAVKNLLDKTK